jgi:2-oxoisovalerate dehydrogenase E2 component (dihydrolipoyl transacylase)
MNKFTFRLPDLGEGTVGSEIGEWLVKVGDDVSEADVLATVMTDKAAVEISSPVSGRILSLAGEPGDMIAVGAPLLVFEVQDNQTASIDEAKSDTPVDEQRDPTILKSDEAPTRLMTSPAVRRRARAAGIDLSLVPGTGPAGRILQQDLERYLASSSTTALSPPAEAPLPDRHEEKVIGMRRIVAERMTVANQEVPHFSYVDQADVTELERLRNHLNDHRDSRLTILPFVGLALIRALRDHPQCNTTYDKERNVLIRHRSIHLGIATQTEQGLKVPVVRHCEARTLDDFATEIVRVATAARENTIDKAKLTGSTITITSLGKLGGIATTPIINLPEVAILGVNRAQERPVVANGQIVIRLMMNLSASFDHRFVDGYEAAGFIQKVKSYLEHPASLFLH